MSASTPAGPDATTVLVVATPAPEVRAWLSAPAASAIEVLPHPGSAAVDLVEVAGVELRRLTAGGWRIVEVPLDAPRPAARLAFRALGELPHRPGTAVSPVPLAPEPPDIDLLVEVQAAGLTPAVDLARVQWMGPRGALVLGPRRLVAVPLPHGDTDRALAEVIVGLGAFPDAVPATTWLQQVADGRTHPDRASWRLALCAGYLEACARRLTYRPALPDAV